MINIRGQSELRQQFKSRASSVANSVLSRFGVGIVPLHRSNGSSRSGRSNCSSCTPLLPPGAAEYLSPSNPQLKELRQRYANHPAARHSLWSTSYLSKELKLKHFRGDNAFIYQARFGSDAAYALTTQYVLEHDELRLLKKLGDDELFGNCLVNFDDSLFVSRDLLDSVLEINFLNRELNLGVKPELSVLDIGAGYGRFAHRIVQSLSNLQRILCTDAVAESTFISNFYLRFREVEEKAQVVPLDKIETVLTNYTIDLATNIHSFGECTYDSIQWWLNLVAANKITFLFVVANGEGLGSREVDETNIEYLPAILERGYRLKTRQPKYSGSLSVQKHGLYPTYYYLFERE
jgi:adenosyl cobinamide kinase/adenosyl cobinamide phosphate guanylyltransferase